MKRILVAALAAVWLAVPAAAGPVQFHLRSDSTTCSFDYLLRDPFACYTTLDFTLDSRDAGRLVHLDKDPGNIGGYFSLHAPDGSILDQTGLTTNWEAVIDGVPRCATICFQARMTKSYQLSALSFVFAGGWQGVPMNVAGSLTEFYTAAEGKLDIWAEGTWTSITIDDSAVVPLPASGLALVTALLGLAWRRRR